MQRVDDAARMLDRLQQRHVAPAFVLAVSKKFGDDNGGVLVSNLAYSAFAAVFPLLLLVVTVAGLLLGHDVQLRNRLLRSAVAQFPIVGQHLLANIRAVERGSAIALTVALVALLWSAQGVAQSGLFAMAQIWGVPGVSRPNYVHRLLRSALFMATLAVGLAVTTGLASLGVSASGVAAIVGLTALTVLANIGQYVISFRVLTPSAISTRRLWPGAVIGGIGWTALQTLGTLVVGHTLRNANEVYGTFAIVLGLLVWVHLGVLLSIYAAEVNVVLAQRLWPRSLAPPPLTSADRRSLTSVATLNQRRPEQEVQVRFARGPSDESAPS